ncbi:hypothetical protein FCV25MIE_27737 [Fagus crenata]
MAIELTISRPDGVSPPWSSLHAVLFVDRPYADGEQYVWRILKPILLEIRWAWAVQGLPPEDVMALKPIVLEIRWAWTVQGQNVA